MQIVFLWFPLVISQLNPWCTWNWIVGPQATSRSIASNEQAQEGAWWVYLLFCWLQEVPEPPPGTTMSNLIGSTDFKGSLKSYKRLFLAGMLRWHPQAVTQQQRSQDYSWLFVHDFLPFPPPEWLPWHYHARLTVSLTSGQLSIVVWNVIAEEHCMERNHFFGAF